MSINLLKKTIRIYKPIAAWNVTVSVLVSLLFYYKGFAETEIYSLAIFFKLLGWAFSLALHYMFYQSSIYFFQNMGIGLKKIMLNLICYDILLFISLLFFIRQCQRFL